MWFGPSSGKRKHSQQYLFKAEAAIIYFFHIRHHYNISRRKTQISPTD